MGGYEMKRYTIGIYFTSNNSEVILIHKKRPDWQKGFWNFPGGKIEDGEVGWQCIEREFFEECRLSTNPKEWQLIGEMVNKDLDYIVFIYTIQGKPEHGRLMQGEDQAVYRFPVDKLPDSIITNCKWLIEFAKNYWDKGSNEDHIESILIKYRK